MKVADPVTIFYTFTKYPNSLKPGLEIEQQPGGYSTFFFPEPPAAKSGEIKLVHESKLKKLDTSVGNLMAFIRKYGQGSAALMNETEITKKIDNL